MRKFAKIFDTESFGQLLIVNDQNDDGEPCIKVSFDACDYDLGICDMTLSDKSGNDQESIDDSFESIDQEKAESIANGLRAQFNEMFS